MEGSGSSNWRRFTRLRPDKRSLRRSAEKIEKATIKHAHKFILSRFESIRNVKRQALGWLLVVALLVGLGIVQYLSLNHSYTTAASSSGGVYAEGVIGQIDVINPLYAATSAEKSASRLVYSGLLSYDSTGELRGELAESWRIERDGLRYVVEIKPDLAWHDGEVVTADDVVFTAGLMQDPVARAQQQRSWSGVKVTKLSDRTVAFDLSRAYAAFPTALTFGILPKHVFGGVEPELLRESSLNREPVGTGPFKFSRIQSINPETSRSVVYLTANADYVRGVPRLERFQLHTFADSEQLKEAFVDREVNAAAGLSATEMRQASESRSDAAVHQGGVDGGVYAFMNMGGSILKDKSVRQALVQATDREKLHSELGNNVLPLGGPLVDDQIPDAKSQLSIQPFDIDRSKQLLDRAGWKLRSGDETRTKQGRELSLRVVSIEADDYPKVVESLAKQWQEVGVKVESATVDADTVQQNVLVPRAYDILVYELEIGSDPDVFAFWHKSQAGPRGLNLSNYRSDPASEALEGAQVRFEPNIRMPKYESFVETWIDDVPAVALYQPKLGFVATDGMSAMRSDVSLPTRIERYANVHHWTVEQASVYKSR